MIIASIAMEELALSHIVNAEGEKLQYILGTLPGSRKPCASTQEILAVNQSAAALLDTVMQSQMLLKGKLEKAPEAGGRKPAPEPPCPPSHPCEPPCPPDCLCEPPCCGSFCCRKSVLQLTSRGVFLEEWLSADLEMPGAARRRHLPERGKPCPGKPGTRKSLRAELRRQRPRPLLRRQRGGRLCQAHTLRRFSGDSAPLLFRKPPGGHAPDAALLHRAFPADTSCTLCRPLPASEL